MAYSTYEKVCYRTQQQDEFVALKNIRTGEIGRSFGCTYEGSTIQVQLVNGALDSWEWDECTEVEITSH